MARAKEGKLNNNPDVLKIVSAAWTDKTVNLREDDIVSLNDKFQIVNTMTMTGV